jgi:hypothetical protein
MPIFFVLIWDKKMPQHWKYIQSLNHVHSVKFLFGSGYFANRTLTCERMGVKDFALLLRVTRLSDWVVANFGQFFENFREAHIFALLFSIVMVTH